MFKEIFLALLVSFDICLAAASFCNSGIKIPAVSAVVISLSGSLILSISLGFSEILSKHISPAIFNVLGMIVLSVIGLATILKSLIRNLAKKGIFPLKKGNTCIIAGLCLDDTAADTDNSKILSPCEAAILALASSFDSAAMGLSCGSSEMIPLRAAVFTFFAGSAALFLGNIIGKKISSLKHDFSWLGGVFLIIFAFFQDM